jgi:hypothetical protein
MTHTTWERLWKAVESLATGEGRIKERLGGALMELAPLMEREFPSELQNSFSKVFERVHEVKDVAGRGAIDVFVEGLSEDEASKVAGEIVSWFDTVAREHCS